MILRLLILIQKNYPKEILDKVKQYGAELVPVKPNLLDIVNTYVKRVADEKGYQQMPYAFNHPAYIDYFSERMKTIQEEYDFDNIVINAVVDRDWETLFT